ncbi:HEAT repeat domain-containing protein [Halapricum sp. CBA1109]|uniref:HEAT repeat domain-containing protein n=1 Tax=Halapricum sp. CBA1109 TaxID=2668068 RepID=UPI002105D90F|nr:HEAT repeat domain-containing protein [Halapricum sp. CBA1109]
MSDHHAVRRNALITLYKRGDPDVFEHAVSLVEDDSDRVREWAAIVLGRVDTDRARPELRHLAADDSDVVARAAQSALEDGAEDSGQGPAPRSARFDQPPASRRK